MPIVIVIRDCAVPASVVVLQSVMSPAVTGIVATNDDPLPCEAECPDTWRMNPVDAGLNRVEPGGRPQIADRLLENAPWIGINMCDLRALRHLLNHGRLPWTRIMLATQNDWCLIPCCSSERSSGDWVRCAISVSF